MESKKIFLASSNSNSFKKKLEEDNLLFESIKKSTTFKLPSDLLPLEENNSLRNSKEPEKEFSSAFKTLSNTLKKGFSPFKNMFKVNNYPNVKKRRRSTEIVKLPNDHVERESNYKRNSYEDQTKEIYYEDREENPPKIVYKYSKSDYGVEKYKKFDPSYPENYQNPVYSESREEYLQKDSYTTSTTSYEDETTTRSYETAETRAETFTVSYEISEENQKPVEIKTNQVEITYTEPPTTTKVYPEAFQISNYVTNISDDEEDEEDYLPKRKHYYSKKHSHKGKLKKPFHGKKLKQTHLKQQNKKKSENFVNDLENRINILKISNVTHQTTKASIELVKLNTKNTELVNKTVIIAPTLKTPILI